MIYQHEKYLVHQSRKNPITKPWKKNSADSTSHTEKNSLPVMRAYSQCIPIHQLHPKAIMQIQRLSPRQESKPSCRLQR